MNFERMLAFSAFDDVLTHLLNQPLLVVVGESAGTFWNSKTAYDKKVRGEKELFIVRGADHFDMYYQENHVNQAAPKIGEFLKTHL